MVSNTPSQPLPVPCAICGHVEASHEGCGQDCQVCGGESSCHECMEVDWRGRSDLHVFQPTPEESEEEAQ